MSTYDLKEIKIVRWRKYPRAGYNIATEVKHDTALSIRNALEYFAKLFRREFHYDFIPYSADHKATDRIKAYIFPEPNNRCYWVGGCSFVERSKEDKKYWALCWIYIHPQFRGEGIVRTAWEKFVKDIGEFRIEGPVSINMQYLLLKMNFPEELVDGGYKIALK